MHKAADRIRNVALAGHRGSGKTSLNEALLFQAGVVNRLGTVTDGTTVSDFDLRHRFDVFDQKGGDRRWLCRTRHV